MQPLHATLMQAPRSPEAPRLVVFVGVPRGLAQDVLRRMFDNVVWPSLAYTVSLLYGCRYIYSRTSTILVERLTWFLTRNLASFRSLGGHWSSHKSPIIHAGRQTDHGGDLSYRGSTYTS